MYEDRPPAPELRPLSLGELLDRALQLFRQLWKPLLVIGLISIIPALLSDLPGLTRPVRSLPIPLTGLAFQTRTAASAGGWWLWLANLLLGPLISGTTILIVSEAILGGRATMGDGIRRVLRRYGGMLGTSFLEGLAFIGVGIGLGLTAFVIRLLAIPLILFAFLYFKTIWAFDFQTLLIEDLPGGTEPLSRSSALAKHRFWPTFGFVCLVWLGMLLFAFGFGLLVGLVQRILPEGAAPLVAVIRLLPSVVTTPASVLAFTLYYYDIRMRKEGFDLTTSLPEEPVS